MTAALAVVIVDDGVDHALIARVVFAHVAPHATVTVITDPRLLSERLIDASPEALVFIDCKLDGYDGVAVLAGVHRARPDLRFVLVSAAMGDGSARSPSPRAPSTRARSRAASLPGAPCFRACSTSSPMPRTYCRPDPHVHRQRGGLVRCHAVY